MFGRSSHAFGSTPSPSSSTPVVPPTPQQDASTTSQNNIWYISKAQAEHDEEFQRGAAIFGVSGDDSYSGTTAFTNNNNKLDDSDFIAYDIGKGNAGPSEMTHSNGHFAYQTTEPTLSEDECKYWTKIAKDSARHAVIGC